MSKKYIYLNYVVIKLYIASPTLPWTVIGGPEDDMALVTILVCLLLVLSSKSAEGKSVSPYVRVIPERERGL